ncbi:Trp biosynthesis-associated membrane protein, partial [Cellulosimicrobium cellulans]
VADATGVTELTAPVDLTVAPWLAAALGVLTVLAVVWVAVGSRSWAGASTRHERASGATAPAAPAAGTAVPEERPDRSRATEPPVPDDLTDHDAWDALSRGEDPTDR